MILRRLRQISIGQVSRWGRLNSHSIFNPTFVGCLFIALGIAGCNATNDIPANFGNPSVSNLDEFADVRRDPQRDTVIFAKSDNLGQELEGQEIYAQLLGRSAYQELAQYFLYAYRDDLRLIDPNSEMALSDIQTDSLGYRQIKFNQIYRNLPVVDCQLIVQVNPAGQLHLLQGRYAQTPDLDDMSPAISEDEATRIVISRLGDGTRVDSLQVVVFPDESGRTFLAYDIQVNRGSLDGSRIILDANTGQELRKTPTSYTGG